MSVSKSLSDLAVWAYGEDVSKGMLEFATKAGREGIKARKASRVEALATMHALDVQPSLSSTAREMKRAKRKSPEVFRAKNAEINGGYKPSVATGPGSADYSRNGNRLHQQQMATHNAPYEARAVQAKQDRWASLANRPKA
jgi:hypothetical protein